VKHCLDSPAIKFSCCRYCNLPTLQLPVFADKQKIHLSFFNTCSEGSFACNFAPRIGDGGNKRDYLTVALHELPKLSGFFPRPARWKKAKPGTKQPIPRYDLAKDIHQLIEERKELEKEVERLRHQQSISKLDEYLKNARELGTGIKLVAGEIPHADMDLLKQLGYESLEKSKKGTITVLGARDEQDGKVYIAASVTDDLIKEKGIKAGVLVGELGKMLDGGGGGQPNLATAGGRNPEKLKEVFDRLDKIVKGHID
jgi:hypothetical protein